jgi:hypothetical protein
MTTKLSNVKEGHMMAFTFYTKVKNIPLTWEGPAINVTNLDTGDEFSVRGKVLIERGKSADSYEKVEEVGKIRAAEILSTSYNTVFTVGFTKKDGTKRKLRGRLIKLMSLLGYSEVEDLDIIKGNRIRQVNHNTIEYIIVDNVMYMVR